MEYFQTAQIHNVKIVLFAYETKWNLFTYPCLNQAGSIYDLGINIAISGIVKIIQG